MPLAIRSISNLVLISSVWALTSCALFEERKGPTTFYGPREQVYFATYEEVWQALNKAVEAYPLRVSNIDRGLLETDEVRANRVWTPPYKRSAATVAGESYQLKFRVIRGELEKKPATKVTVIKEAEVHVDFFSDPKNMPSDGLEEKTVIYRIGREIQIARALEKAQKKQNENGTEPKAE